MLPLWVLVGFVVAQLFVTLLLFLLDLTPFAITNKALASTIFAAATYSVSLLIVVGVPWLLGRHTTSRQELGLARLISWGDIGISTVGFIGYLLLSAVLLYIVTLVFPGFNGAEVQNTGFGNVSQRHEFILAFLTLVVVAPLAEEILFRGYLYGKLRKTAPVWLAMILTSILFAAIHGQWNVAVDVFALSIILCILRETTKSIWAGILLHMIKNGIAFYLLFINPSLLRIMGG